MLHRYFLKSWLANCVDQYNRIRNRCLDWIAEIDECGSAPCVNDGTCVNGINSYTCLCVAGYTDLECATGDASLFLQSLDSSLDIEFSLSSSK